MIRLLRKSKLLSRLPRERMQVALRLKIMPCRGKSAGLQLLKTVIIWAFISNKHRRGSRRSACFYLILYEIKNILWLIRFLPIRVGFESLLRTFQEESLCSRFLWNHCFVNHLFGFCISLVVNRFWWALMSTSLSFGILNGVYVFAICLWASDRNGLDSPATAVLAQRSVSTHAKRLSPYQAASTNPGADVVTHDPKPLAPWCNTAINPNHLAELV